MRPTMGKTRDAIFKILNSGSFSGFLLGAKFLDLFCGSGAVALEALSRGASHAIMVDENPEYLNIARMNAEALQESKNITILHCSVPCSNKSSNLYRAVQESNIIFADAPYNSGLANKILLMLAKNSMQDNSIIVLEISRLENIEIPICFKQLTDRYYGKSRILVIKKIIREFCEL